MKLSNYFNMGARNLSIEYYVARKREFLVTKSYLVDAYRAGLDKLTTLDCAILLTPHPTASKMRGRLLASEGLVDINSCKSYAAGVSARLQKRLTAEKVDLK